jgi:hypothetical protein
MWRTEADALCFAFLNAVTSMFSIVILRAARSSNGSAGDCDDDDRVTIDELVQGVNIALRNRPVTVCPNADQDGNHAVTIEELVAAVTNALDGCADPTGGPRGDATSTEDGSR